MPETTAESQPYRYRRQSCRVVYATYNCTRDRGSRAKETSGGTAGQGRGHGGLDQDRTVNLGQAPQPAHIRDKSTTARRKKTLPRAPGRTAVAKTRPAVTPAWVSRTSKAKSRTAPRAASRLRRMLVSRRRIPGAYRFEAVREHGAAIHHQAAAHGQPAASNGSGAAEARADAGWPRR